MRRKFIFWTGVLLLLLLILCCILTRAGKIAKKRAAVNTAHIEKTERVKEVLAPEEKLARENAALATFLSGHTISFKTNTAQIDENGRQVLDDVYAMLKSEKNLHLVIVGHTDASGNDAYNRDLSRRRAQAVADYLRQKGLTDAVFEVIGKGSTEPIAENGTQEGRLRNRRVEIRIKGD